MGDEHGDEDMEFHDDGERWDPAEGRPDEGNTKGKCTPDNVAAMKMAFGKTKKDFAEVKSFQELMAAMMRMESRLNMPVFQRCVELTMRLVEFGEKDFKVDGVFGCTEEPQDPPDDNQGGGGGGDDHYDPFPNSTDPCCKESLKWNDCCKTKDVTMKRH